MNLPMTVQTMSGVLGKQAWSGGKSINGKGREHQGHGGASGNAQPKKIIAILETRRPYLPLGSLEEILQRS